MSHVAAEQLPEEITSGIDPTSTWLSVLQFFCKEGTDSDFAQLMEEMYELAQKQPGYLWGHYGRSLIDGRYFIISEWESRKAMKDWENVEEHGLAMDKGDPLYHAGRVMENRKFIPWYKPGAKRKAWTG